MSEHLLLRALKGEPTERTPVWAMRQAGRWDPEFRKLRGNLSFFEFSENAELSAQASLLPMRFGVDAIILFYDITTLAIAMGQTFDLVPGKGPVPREPIRTEEDVARLRRHPDPASYEHLLRMAEMVRRELAGRLPILFFAGAPFTLASYQTGLGRDPEKIGAFIKERPRVFESLLEATAEATIHFLRQLKIASGDAYQLFDSWAGSLNEADYDRYCHSYHRQIFTGVGGPSILFVKDLPYVDLGIASGCTALSLGRTHDLADLRQRFPKMVFQGNVDHELLISGTADEVREATRQCLKEGGGCRHILNLDHGMDPNARIENFRSFVEAAKVG